MERLRNAVSCTMLLLSAVALEAVERRAADDGGELLGEVEGIVNAAARPILAERSLTCEASPAINIRQRT